MPDIVERRKATKCDQQDEIRGLREDLRLLTAQVDALTAGRTATDGQNAEILALLTEIKAAQAPIKTSFVAKRG